MMKNRQPVQSGQKDLFQDQVEHSACSDSQNFTTGNFPGDDQKVAEQPVDGTKSSKNLGNFEYKSIPLRLITPNGCRARLNIDDELVQQLADSIFSNGLAEPVVVRRIEKNSSGEDCYELIAGELRLNAFQRLNRLEIPSVIVQINDSDMRLAYLIPNLLRNNLADFEVFNSLRQEFSEESDEVNHTKIASALGISRATLYRYYAFNQMPDFVIESLTTKPFLISKKTADQVKTVLAKYGERAHEKLAEIWPQVVDESLSQSKLAKKLTDALKTPEETEGNDDKGGIWELIQNDIRIGSITFDRALPSGACFQVELNQNKIATITLIS